ncbi:MAG: hypothetical protein MJ118_06820, partial [Clostridia bacterium]|nr:hypothetical protein [Clostridia bacterium]
TFSVTFSTIRKNQAEKSLRIQDFLSSATTAWEADVLPMYESCRIYIDYTSLHRKKQSRFFRLPKNPSRRFFLFRHDSTAAMPNGIAADFFGIRPDAAP